MDSSEYVNINAVCRICLSQRGCINVFENSESNSPPNTVADRIMSFARIEVQKDDGLPDKICRDCLAEIDHAFNLKAQCEYADTALRQLCSEDQEADNVVCFLEEGCNSETKGDLVQSFESPIIVDVPTVDLTEDGSTVVTCIDHKPDLPSLMEACVSLDQMLDISQGPTVENDTTTTIVSTAPSDENERLDERIDSPPIRVHENEGNEAPPLVLSRKVLKHVRPQFRSKACTDCGEQFTSMKELETHAAIYVEHKPFQCDTCRKSFRCARNLRDHEKRHKGKKSFLCSNCGQFATAKKNHYCTAQNDKLNKSFACDVCQKKFVSSTSLLTHKKRHAGVSKFQCSECEKLYFSRQELERHMRVHFNIRPFACPEEDCSLTFFSQGELNRHKRYHSGLKKFSCDLCGQKFFESGHLANHLRKHTGERPYTCRHCCKSFRDSSKLRRHSLIHLEPTSKRRKRSAAVLDHDKYSLDKELSQ